MKNINHIHFSSDIDVEQWKNDQDCISLALYGQRVYRKVGEVENTCTPPYNADFIEYTPATCTDKTVTVIRHTWIDGHSPRSAGFDYAHKLYTATWR
jgi:hypothetical protein